MAPNSNDPSDLDNIFSAVGDFFGEPSTGEVRGASGAGTPSSSWTSSPASGSTTSGSPASGMSSPALLGGLASGGAALGSAAQMSGTSPTGIDRRGARTGKTEPTSGGTGSGAGGGVTPNGSGSGNLARNGSRSTAVEWQPRPFGKKLPLALATLGLLGAGVAHGAITKGRVEDDLRRDALAKLRAQYPGLDVTFDGRDATISGSIPDLAAKKKAHDLVRNITGVRHVSEPNLVIGTAEPAAEADVGLADTIGDEPTSERAAAADTTAPAANAPETTAASAATTAAPTAAVPSTAAPSTAVTTTAAPTTEPPAPAADANGDETATSIPDLAGTLPSAPPAINADSANAEVQAVQPITFAKNVSSLGSDADPAIRQIVDFLQANPDVELAVSGYTDSSGTNMTNRAVSAARAQAVRDALINAGIAPNRITALGYGSRNPIASNDTEEGRAANRRVEFRFFGGDAPNSSGSDEVSFTG